MRAVWSNLLNIAGFQAVWLCAVMGSASGRGWLGPAACALFCLAHSRRPDVQPREFGLALSVGAFGMLIDSAYLAAGLLRFAAPGPFEFAAPLWIGSLWVAFALTLGHALAWLENRHALAAVFGLVGGAGAYLAGVSLGAVEALIPAWQLAAAVGLVWAAVTPGLFLLERRWTWRTSLKKQTL